MTDLEQSLQGRDFGHLKIIAALWHVELTAPDFKSGVAQLVELLTDNTNFETMFAALPEGAHSAVQDVVRNKGRMTWSQFTHRYGDVREMGSAQRDRVQPYLEGQGSIAEALWYRALIGRAFFDTPDGLQEFAFIPEEFFELLRDRTADQQEEKIGRPATPAEKALVILAGDQIVDDVCTYLAGARMGLPPETIQVSLICGQNSTYPLTVQMLKALLETTDLLNGEGVPRPERVREFLEGGRPQALVWLMQAWLKSSVFNELWLLPGLVCEGEWRNNPLTARKNVMDFLSRVPGWSQADQTVSPAPFWSLSAFVAAVRQQFPDFQRSAGDYDSWFITRRQDGKNLRGFEHWDEVEGELIRFIIGGPLFWLGVVDLGFAKKPDEAEQPLLTSFRISAAAPDLLAGRPPAGLPEENKKLIAKSDGLLVAPRLVPRAGRYQVARFCDWDGFSHGDYLYRLSPGSLRRAEQQGLQIAQFLSLVSRYAQAVPTSLVRALKRWGEQGSEIQITHETILRVKRPEILQALKNSKANRYLGEQLGPTAIIVHAGAHQKVVNELIAMGYFADALFNET